MKPVHLRINRHVTPLIVLVTPYTLTSTTAAQEALNEPEAELNLQVWLLVYDPVQVSILS